MHERCRIEKGTSPAVYKYTLPTRERAANLTPLVSRPAESPLKLVGSVEMAEKKKRKENTDQSVHWRWNTMTSPFFL